MRSDLKPWEHPNIATWVRHDTKRALVASVDISPLDKSVTATVLVSGQRVVRSFATDESAKAWCDENLEADVEAPEPEPVIPEEPPVERLIRMLHNDPDFAWLLANRAKVLGPWHWDEMEQQWIRLDITGAFTACVRPEDEMWTWLTYVGNLRTGSDIEHHQDNILTPQEARLACDEHLRTQGWLLATKPLETT